MNYFHLQVPRSIADAVKRQACSPTAQHGASVRFIAGGTNLIDYMKLNVEQPTTLIDINSLPLGLIEASADGGVRIGALARNADVATHPVISTKYAVLSQALLAGASPQLRNMATTAGNLLQRTRCVYFRDTAADCNKRRPGSGCAAMAGYNRNLAILGTSEHCIASNPSDQNVALVALDATIELWGLGGAKSIPITDFYQLPGSTPERETALEPGDLITHVTLPAPLSGARGLYLKLRDRASYEFALASAAVIVRMDSRDCIDFVRIALGGVGTRPWRSPEAEEVLLGRPPSPATFTLAAEAALRDARPQSGNAFKVELARRCLVHALTQNLASA